MSLSSFENGYKPARDSISIFPEFLMDLNIDQIIKSAIAGKEEYNLEPLFLTKLTDKQSIHSRQDVFRDLENKRVFDAISNFAKKMVVMHRYLNFYKGLHYKYYQEGWFLEASLTYIDALITLSENIEGLVLKSEWLRDFFVYLNSYLKLSEFLSFFEQSKSLKAKLTNIQYSIIIKNNWVRVRRYKNEIDFRKEIRDSFSKFQVGEAKDYLVALPDHNGMSHVHAQILGLVAKLNPNEFKQLDQYWLDHNRFLDERIMAFKREIQFYISYLEYIQELKEAGLKFCYPVITTQKTGLNAMDCFDLALAKKLVSEKKKVICNDFSLAAAERIIVVSGPNQGGKTTFARMFGQVHYLANLGCPVPGSKAKLFLFDNLFSHFEREENIKNLRGKLQDDLIRIRTILEKSTDKSIIIMNEIFTTTTLKDAVYLSKKIVEKILLLDSYSVFVTFIDELSRMCEKTISMVSTVLPDNPAVRTFKIIRKPADGLAYAKSIAEKYHLTYDELKARIKA